MSDEHIGDASQQPPDAPFVGLLSEIAMRIGLDARRSFCSHHRLPIDGPIDESGCSCGHPDYDGIAKAQAWFRESLSDDRLRDLAEKLQVEAAFLREFDLGWCEELGSATVATVDDTGCIAGAELLPLAWSREIMRDVGPLYGLRGLIAIPRTVRRGADLVVSGDWRALEAEWVKGNNVAFQEFPLLGLCVAQAIVIRHRACGGSDVRVRMLDHATLDPGAAALRQWFWDDALKKARGEE